ncbi:MAG: hypothetical protein GY777_11855 [Candidatus Brocadiaceae bacterium]|nr:hypothetical protein [Candidatus Brocadiaceae bacterium]
MGTNRFLQFVNICGYVNEEVALKALNIQKERTLAIGRIALEEKMLTVKEIFMILNKQTDSPKLFGEIAIDMGFLKKTDIDLLMEFQKESRPRIGEILVEIGAISKKECDNLLKDYDVYKQTCNC